MRSQSPHMDCGMPAKLRNVFLRRGQSGPVDARVHLHPEQHPPLIPCQYVTPDFADRAPPTRLLVLNPSLQRTQPYFSPALLHRCCLRFRDGGEVRSGRQIAPLVVHASCAIVHDVAMFMCHRSRSSSLPQ
jgi:hypothetical protein